MVGMLLGAITALLIVVFVQQLQTLNLLRDIFQHLKNSPQPQSFDQAFARLRSALGGGSVPAPPNIMK